jgi:hypothetical protein
MTLDIIVHPASFIYSNQEIEKQRYWERIQKIKNTSKNVLVVNHKIRKIIDTDFDEEMNSISTNISRDTKPEKLFYSKDPIINGEQLTYGYISKNDFQRFSSFLDPKDEIRIRGCFYGQCTSNLALQIVYYFQTNRDDFSFFKSKMTYNEFLNAYKKEGRKIFKVELWRKIQSSNIRYGTVFSSDSIVSKNHRSLLSKVPMIRSLDDQLTDSKTKIYGVS